MSYEWKPINTVPDDVKRILGGHLLAPNDACQLRRLPSGYWQDDQGNTWLPSHWLPSPPPVPAEADPNSWYPEITAPANTWLKTRRNGDDAILYGRLELQADGGRVWVSVGCQMPRETPPTHWAYWRPGQS